MSALRERFRELLSQPECQVAAPVFDPLSARVADMLGWRIAKLSGSSLKLANLAVPDDLALSGTADLADTCARIHRVSDLALIVDADDGGGTAVSVFRTIRDLESAGAAAVEIDDRLTPRGVDGRSPGSTASDVEFASVAEQVGKLRAAVAARRDPTTVIVARTNALAKLPQREAMDRIKAYSQTGAEALMLESIPLGRADIEAARRATELPLCILNVPADVVDDAGFMSAHGVRVRFVGHAVIRMVVKTLVDGLQALKDGKSFAQLSDRMAPLALMQTVDRSSAFAQWRRDYES